MTTDRFDSALAADGEEFAFRSAGQDWIVSFHPASQMAPGGKNHGAAGFCFTTEGQIVLVSKNGVAWEPPAGRPEGDEGLRQALDREVVEEGSARVEDAVLLGYSKGIRVRGREEGLVIVRSLWWASVAVLPHVPDYEMKHRLLVPAREALECMGIEPRSPAADPTPRASGHPAIYRRFYLDAMSVQARALSC